MSHKCSWITATAAIALAVCALPAQAQTLVGALGAASIASGLQGIGSNAAAIGHGAVNNLGGRQPAPAVPTVASGTASTRPATTGGTATTARPAPATNNRPTPATTPARPATQPAAPTTPARPAATPATPRPTGGTNNTGTNGNATTGTGGSNSTQTSGGTPGRGAGYTANLTNNGYGRGVRGGAASGSLGGRSITPLRPVFNATALGQTLRDARINIRMGFANISSSTPASGNATARQ